MTSGSESYYGPQRRGSREETIPTQELLSREGYSYHVSIPPVATKTQPTQLNPTLSNLGISSPTLLASLTPTQPSNPSPDPIWGVLEPSDKGESIFLSLPEKSYTFGRSGKCNFKFPDANLSGVHCAFVLLNENAFKAKDYKVAIVDKQSLNGTYINNYKTVPDRETILKDGDIIYLTKMDPETGVKFKELSFTFRVPFTETLYQRYKVNGLIGKGHFSVVRESTCRITNSKVAIKLLNKAQLDGVFNPVYMEREIDIMKRVSHPFIACIIEVVSSQQHIGLVMAWAPDGDLFDYFCQHKHLPADSFPRIFYQILSAVHYLHSNEIVHRDIKPENVLLFDQRTLQVKLTDFGLARFFDNRKDLSSLVGSPSYAAPEVNTQFSNRSYTCACDMWSIGVMMYFAFKRKLPFAHLKGPVILQNTAQLDNGWSESDKHIKDLILRLLVYLPDGRLTAEKALKTKYFIKCYDVYKDLVKTELDFVSTSDSLRIPRDHIPLDRTGSYNNARGLSGSSKG